MDMQVPMEEILKNMRETIGNQAQEIALLKAALNAQEQPSANS